MFCSVIVKIAGFLFSSCQYLFNFGTEVKHLKSYNVVITNNFYKLKVIFISKTSSILNVFDFRKAPFKN